MIAVGGRQAPRMVASALLCLALLAAAATLVARLGPVPHPEVALFPILAVACALLAAWLRVDNGAWALEAPMLGATAAALGPWWAGAAGLAGFAASSLLRTGRLGRHGDAFGLTALAFGCGAAALAGQFLPDSGALAAGTFVGCWRGVHFTLERSRFSSIWQVGVPTAVAAAVGGILDSGHGLLAFAGLAPAAVAASIAHYESRTSESRREALQALALMLQRAHPYTHAHIERVACLAERTALKLGLPLQKARLIHEAARLHDIGKIAVDEQILDKPGKLTDDEYEHVKLHAPFGAAILEEIEELRSIADWIRFHHERPDGEGYPRGLRGEQIPIEARIIAVADAFDAMTGGFAGGEKRPYREPVSPYAAIQEMERCSGSQFDPQVVAAFTEAIKEENLA